jgi:hypothetical protein
MGQSRRNGLIRVYPAEKNLPNPITDLAPVGDILFAGDNRANRVLMYDKNTGAARGEWAFSKPGRMEADARGRLWIVQNATDVVVCDASGNPWQSRLKGWARLREWRFCPVTNSPSPIRKQARSSCSTWPI